MDLSCFTLFAVLYCFVFGVDSYYLSSI